MDRGGTNGNLRFLTFPVNATLDGSLVRRICEPGSGKERLYVISGEHLYEMVEETGKDRAVYSNGKFYQAAHHLYISPLDPFFFVAAKVGTNKNRANQSWNDLIHEFPELRNNERLCKLRDQYLHQKESLKDSTVVYYADDKELLKYYSIMFSKLCVKRLCECDDPSSYVSMRVHNSWFHEFVRLVPSRLHTMLAAHFNIDLTTRKNETQNAKHVMEEDEERIVKAPPPKKVKISTTQKQLAKASKGTKSITSFFTKK